MKRKNVLSLLLPCLVAGNMYANEPTTPISIATPSKEIRAFHNLEVGVTAGTTGIGIDFSTPINSYLQVRGGFSMMPKFTLSMDFSIGIEDRMYLHDENGSISLNNQGEALLTDFGKAINLIENVTGNKIQNKVTMLAEPQMHNFKILLDIHPFHNKHWRFTGGFYVGPRTIARIYNSPKDMPTFYAANMFNKMYDKASEGTEDDPMPIMSLYGIDIYAGPAFLSYGRIGLDVGRHQDNTIYKLTPNESCIVSVEARTNSLKPYLGFGYTGGTGKTHFIFDCGILIWGGAPDLITHDGTNLTHDITNIEGKIGDYVNLTNRFIAYPALSFGISRVF